LQSAFLACKLAGGLSRALGRAIVLESSDEDAARPAAYICVASASRAEAAERRNAVSDAASRRGWPEPAVYVDDCDPSLAEAPSPMLTRLVGEVRAGRHDMVLVAGLAALSRGAGSLVPQLLFPCISNGVPVEFL
jgi:hypothetical protein